MKYLMLDVESTSLQGDVISVGCVIVDTSQTGSTKIKRAFYGAVRVSPDTCNPFVAEHVWPVVGQHEPVWYANRDELRSAFVSFWLEKKLLGYRLIADVPWPVEANFLTSCSAFFEKAEDLPYPLYDLASMLSISGYDPLAEYGRLPHETPKHNALADAMHSARMLVGNVLNAKNVFVGKYTTVARALNNENDLVEVVLCAENLLSATVAILDEDDDVVLMEVKQVAAYRPKIR